MAFKRVASRSPKRSLKKCRYTKLIPTVVDTITGSEAVQSDVQTLLKKALPIVFGANAADRTSHEAEVIEQAAKSLKAVESALQASHAEALQKQTAVIAPAEQTRRSGAKEEAGRALDAAKAALEAAQKNTQEKQAISNTKEAEAQHAKKENDSAAGAVKALEAKKGSLEGLLNTDFAQLKDGSSAGAAGKKQVQAVLAAGKKFGLDSTLLATFPAACKRPAANRTEFETMMFDNLKASIEREIASFAEKVAEAEAIRAEKAAAAEAANAAKEAADKDVEDAISQRTAAKQGVDAAKKALQQAEKVLVNIWADMREACDAQDDLAAQVKHVKEVVWAAFSDLKERAPEPEPEAEAPPPAEEAAEAAAVAPEA